MLWGNHAILALPAPLANRNGLCHQNLLASSPVHCPSGTSVEQRRMSIINAAEQYSSELQADEVVDCSSYQLPGGIR